MREIIKDLLLAFIPSIILQYGFFDKNSKFHLLKLLAFMEQEWFKRFYKTLMRIQQVCIMIPIMLGWYKTTDHSIGSFLFFLVSAFLFSNIMYRSLTVGYANIPEDKYHPFIRTCRYIIGI